MKMSIQFASNYGLSLRKKGIRRLVSRLFKEIGETEMFLMIMNFPQKFLKNPGSFFAPVFI